jgi:hypothetical protein
MERVNIISARLRAEAAAKTCLAYSEQQARAALDYIEQYIPLLTEAETRNRRSAFWDLWRRKRRSGECR